MLSRASLLQLIHWELMSLAYLIIRITDGSFLSQKLLTMLIRTHVRYWPPAPEHLLRFPGSLASLGLRWSVSGAADIWHILRIPDWCSTSSRRGPILQRILGICHLISPLRPLLPRRLSLTCFPPLDPPTMNASPDSRLLLQACTSSWCCTGIIVVSPFSRLQLAFNIQGTDFDSIRLSSA